VDAQTGPVMIAYPAAAEIDAILDRTAARTPAVDVTADSGVRHQMWVIDNDEGLSALTRAFDKLPAVYIADGHHRSAAAARVSEGRSARAGSHRYFLAVLFPHHEMTILDYNRVIRDLNGRTPAQLLAELRKRMTVETSDKPVAPTGAAEFGMHLA